MQSTFFKNFQQVKNNILRFKSNTGLIYAKPTYSNNNYHTNQQHQSNNNNYQYLKYLGLSLLPVIYHKFKLASCDNPIQQGNEEKLNNRISTIQYSANNPIEDRYVYFQLESIDAKFICVLDGHGGWQVAELAKNNFKEALENALEFNKKIQFGTQEEYVTKSIENAFDALEEQYLQIAKSGYNIGFYQMGRAGACVLGALIYKNKLYAANSGDCKGVICKQVGDEIQCTKINKKLNAGSKKEQQRLKQQFQNESDIIFCKPV